LQTGRKRLKPALSFSGNGGLLPNKLYVFVLLFLHAVHLWEKEIQKSMI